VGWSPANEGEHVIIEEATVSIKPERIEEFEAAFGHASGVLLEASGCRSVELLRCIESPEEFQIVVGWDTLEDHTVRFRESDVFPRWRALVGGFFTSSPVVRHYQVAQPARR
jgi:heme-degrading monooxygenase HmoA